MATTNFQQMSSGFAINACTFTYFTHRKEVDILIGKSLTFTYFYYRCNETSQSLASVSFLKQFI